MRRKGVNASELSRASGVRPQLISEYVSGKKVAGAENLFALADALDVYPRWLLLGEGAMFEPPELAGDEATRLPLYDLFEFNEMGKPKPREEVAIPSRWLMAAVRTTSGLWLAEMPSDALPDVAAEGQTIICRDPQSPLQDNHAYILLLDGRLIARRIIVGREGLTLSGGEHMAEITLRPDELDRLIPVGRVLAAITLNPA